MPSTVPAMKCFAHGWLLLRLGGVRGWKVPVQCSAARGLSFAGGSVRGRKLCSSVQSSDKDRCYHASMRPCLSPITTMLHFGEAKHLAPVGDESVRLRLACPGVDKAFHPAGHQPRLRLFFLGACGRSSWFVLHETKGCFPGRSCCQVE